MEAATIITDKGNINISRITLEILIRLVLQNINGIIQPKKAGFPKILQTYDADAGNGKMNRNISPDVKIEIKPDSVLINLFLTINYGIRIPDLTWEVQAKVKEKIKEVTGLDIEQINVHIQGIYFSKRYNSKKKLVSQGSFLKIF
jgi:uncharacterized alkaline shock family protein YloU